MYQCSVNWTLEFWCDCCKKTDIGYICLTFLHCAFSNVSSNGLPEKRHSGTDYICLAFLHCVFSNVFSNCLPKKRHSHIGCICSTFLRCAFSNVSSNGLHEKRHIHIGCTCLTLWHCQSFSSGFPHPSIQRHNFDKFVPLCCGLSKWLLQTDSKPLLTFSQ